MTDETPPPNEPPPKPKRARKKPAGKPTAHQDGRGRFLPGNQANPAGRPKGSRNRTTLLIEGLLEDEAEKLTKALIKRAMQGSTHALELAFARLCPVRKERQIELVLPKIDSLSDLVMAHGSVIDAVAGGEISPAEGREMAALLDMRRRAVESVDLLARLEALENQLQNRNHNYAN